MSDNRDANIRLKPNVICKRLYSDEQVKIRELDMVDVAKRLAYYELRALRDAAPNIFTNRLCDYDNLTKHQQVQHDAFLKESGSKAWRPVSFDYKPIQVVLTYQNEVKAAGTYESPAEDSYSKSEYSIPIDTKAEQHYREVKDESKEATSEETTLKDKESLDRQTQVIEASLDSNILVLAPPGTGKTYVLIERLVYLLNTKKYENPAEEVLVLSFTRATVSEIRRRLAERLGMGGGDDLRYVGVRTFDSFATRALIDHLGEQRMDSLLYSYRSSGSYSKRIRLFTDVLQAQKPQNISSMVSGLRYLIIDEIQDLVCERANMVLALMQVVLGNAGRVLLLGDPAQGIYDYQADSEWGCPEKITSQSFLSSVRGLIGEKRRDIAFREFYRYADQSIKEFVRQARFAMGDDGSCPDKEELLRLVYNLGTPVDFSQLPAYAAVEGRTAVLVRTNAEAYQIKHWCDVNGVPVRLHRGARGGYWPPCLARVLYGWKQDSMSLRKFEEIWGKKGADRNGIALGAIKGQLQKLRVLDDNRIDILRLRYMMATEPAPIEDIPDNFIVVSNVHRAKGLEYDSVLVLAPHNSGLDSSEELRVLYVAATRAKKKLSILNRDEKIIQWASRVGKTTYRKVQNAIYTNGPGDLDTDLLAEGLDAPSGRSTIQSILWERYLHGGDAMICIKEVGGLDVFVLAVATENDRIEDVCWCDDEFGSALWGSRNYAKRLGDGRTGWKMSLQGIASVAYDPSDDDATKEFGTAGMVLVPVLGARIIVK